MRSPQGSGPVSFTVAAGETLGLVGLRGAGHHAIGRAIFGEPPLASGRLVLDGAQIDPQSPAEAMALGLGFVSSRRAEESIAANLSVRENIFINPTLTGKGCWNTSRAFRKQKRLLAALNRFSVKAEGPGAAGGDAVRRQPAESRGGAVDGGDDVKLLILEEPTIGVDVGSKAEIYRLLQGSLREGLAALLISSDFEEVERICHRALVFSRGRVVAELQRGRIDDRRPLPRPRRAEPSPAAREQRRERQSEETVVQRRRHARDFGLGAPGAAGPAVRSPFRS